MGRKPNTAGIKVDPNEIDYESMIFYISWYKQLLKLEQKYGEEVFTKGFKELCEYSFHGIVPDNSDNPVLEMFFDMARASIDANIKLRIAGKMGNEARWGKKEETEEKPKGRRGRKKKEPEQKEERPLTPREEAIATGHELVDEDGFYPATPHNIAIDMASSE